MAKQRRSEAKTDTDAGLLGKPLATYSALKGGLLLVAVAVILGLSGGVVLGAAKRIAHRAEATNTTMINVVGWTMIALATPMIGWGVFQLGRKFEIRRQGVRYTRRRIVQEMTWDEVYDIQVRKTVLRRRGSKHVNWEVEIFGIGESIYLAPGFLRQVSSVAGLVHTLKTASGKDIELPPLV